jgi:hypothetical protein
LKESAETRLGTVVGPAEGDQLETHSYVETSPDNFLTVANEKLQVFKTPKFKHGDRIKQKDYGEGMVSGVSPDSKTVYVVFDSDKAKYMTACASKELKLVNVKDVKPTKAKFKKGDVVSHSAYATGRFLGYTKTAGVGRVSFDLLNTVSEVHEDELTLELRASKKELRVRDKSDQTKFENLPLLCGFNFNSKHHVKVGNTTAIATGGVRFNSEGEGYITLTQFGLSSPEKIRLKKSTLVQPLPTASK